MTEVYKIMTSTEKELTKGANSCSISILLQEDVQWYSNNKKASFREAKGGITPENM